MSGCTHTFRSKVVGTACMRCVTPSYTSTAARRPRSAAGAPLLRKPNPPTHTKLPPSTLTRPPPPETPPPYATSVGHRGCPPPGVGGRSSPRGPQRGPSSVGSPPLSREPRRPSLSEAPPQVPQSSSMAVNEEFAAKSPGSCALPVHASCARPPYQGPI